MNYEDDIIDILVFDIVTKQIALRDTYKTKVVKQVCSKSRLSIPEFTGSHWKYRVQIGIRFILFPAPCTLYPFHLSQTLFITTVVGDYINTMKMTSDFNFDLHQAFYGYTKNSKRREDCI